MKFTVSAVQSDAAQIRSNSFSRDGSSAQTTILPAAISAMISSIGLKRLSVSDMGGTAGVGE
jgi:hypothetical protein